MTLFEHEGINVWVENGKIIIADEQEREEYVDTPENREMCLEKARKIVEEWENEL